MHSIWLLLLWSLSFAFAAASRRTGLRNANDVYTVEASGSQYLVYSRYYYDGDYPVTTMAFKGDQIIIPLTWNANEDPHTDGSARLHLSDIIRLVANNHARKPLSSIEWLVIKNVSNDQTISVVRNYQNDYERRARPGATVPSKLTVKPSDPFWSTFRGTPFFKAANFAFQPNGKSVISIDIVSNWGTNLWFRMG
ncbi:hypothetical protein LX36DRAFT_190719 [Colletotrichum falcatum]|nr:hypothetical protein LX36DRAFT_190719 [Colletotrichum falcatum]